MNSLVPSDAEALQRHHVLSLTRPARRVGLLLALVLAILPPGLYFLIEAEKASEQVATEARAQANLVTRVVARQSEDWAQHPEAVSAAVIDVRHPAHRSEIHTADGAMVLSMGNDQEWPQRAAVAEFLSCTMLSRFDPARPVFVEAESKRVGKLTVPDELMARMRASPCVEVQMPEPARVALLREDYLHLIEDPALLFEKLHGLIGLHSRDTVDQWKSLARAGQRDAFVSRMLVEHYDPAYHRSRFSNYSGARSAQPLIATGHHRADFERLVREFGESTIARTGMIG